MTSKIITWATFCIVATGVLPILSTASAAPALSSQVSAPLDNKIMALPNCGKCSIKPPIYYTTTFAVDPYNVCDSAAPYRLFGRTNQKILCQYGNYWFCDDSSSNSCSTYIERPPCPDNTCIRTQ